MQLSLLLIGPPLAMASYPTADINEWHPPVDGDFRGPCPMMNTLANHGFLPRDGRNITRENAVAALVNGLNFDSELANIMWEQAIIANPEPNATYFTLDNLNRHNVLEHDASLSRSDAYFGDNHVFNQSIFDASKEYWTAEILEAEHLANSKIFRQVESRSTNPNYTFTATTESFSLGEVAAPFIAFGDLVNALVNRTFVEYFFENERLPSELGWSKKADAVTLDQIIYMSGVMADATSLLTGTPVTTQSKRRDLHAGI